MWYHDNINHSNDIQNTSADSENVIEGTGNM